jgi:hypothetical protein
VELGGGPGTGGPCPPPNPPTQPFMGAGKGGGFASDFTGPKKLKGLGDGVWGRGQGSATPGPLPHKSFPKQLHRNRFAFGEAFGAQGDQDQAVRFDHRGEQPRGS